MAGTKARSAKQPLPLVRIGLGGIIPHLIGMVMEWAEQPAYGWLFPQVDNSGRRSIEAGRWEIRKRGREGEEPFLDWNGG